MQLAIREYLLSKYGLQILVVLLAGGAAFAEATGCQWLWPTLVVLAVIAEGVFVVWSIAEADVAVGSLKELGDLQAAAIEAPGTWGWDRWKYDDWKENCQIVMGFFEKAARSVLGLAASDVLVTANLMAVFPTTTALDSDSRMQTCTRLLGVRPMDLYGPSAPNTAREDLTSAVTDARSELITVYSGNTVQVPPVYLRQHGEPQKVMFGAPRAVQQRESKSKMNNRDLQLNEFSHYIPDTTNISVHSGEVLALADLRAHAQLHLPKNHVLGFISIALFFRGEVVGVLNLNCSRSEFLKAPKRQALFTAVLQPFLPVAALLVYVYRERYSSW